MTALGGDGLVIRNRVPPVPPPSPVLEELGLLQILATRPTRLSSAGVPSLKLNVAVLCRWIIWEAEIQTSTERIYELRYPFASCQFLGCSTVAAFSEEVYSWEVTL